MSHHPNATPDPSRMRRAWAAAPVALMLAVAGCGGDQEPSTQGAASARSGDGPQHIHGLGINPADDSLVIATHTGLFRATADQQRAKRIGDSYQDTMGFTVIGPNRFLGSGHPDLQTDLPPLLGLIRSDNAGRNWNPVSLLGKADFHILRAAGRRVYGINAIDGKLFVSDDGGRTWSARALPGPTLDLVAHPEEPEHLIASGEDELYVSRDGGKGWRPRASDRAGLLAWTRRETLILLDAQGAVHRSGDAGGTWERVGDIGGQPAALGSHRSTMYVALHTNAIKISRDGGRSWQLRVAP